MKLLSITFIFVLAMNCSRSQIPYYDQNKNQDMQEIVSAQQAGYLLTALGASAIIYAATKSSTVKNPTAWYIGGSALITGGICLIIFGKKEKEPQYWKGMQGYRPDKNLKNGFLISIPEHRATANLKLFKRKLKMNISIL